MDRGPKRSSYRKVATWQAGPLPTNEPQTWYQDGPVAWVTFGEQSMAISRERRSSTARPSPCTQASRRIFV
jgi:hypothetical protein